MPLNRVEIFRHGVAKYAQGIVSWETAADLTESGRNVVKENAVRLANDYRGIETEVAIFSSPLGRTLESSLIIKDELDKAGLKTEGENGIPIKVRRCLQDQINFSNSIVKLLACGGEWSSIAGQIIIDPRRTNPTEIDTSKYCVADALNMGIEAWRALPDELKAKILVMETSEQIKRRILRFITSLGKLNINRDLVVVVTHDALITQLLKSYGDEMTRIPPGGRVTAEVSNGEFIVRNMA